MSLISPVTQDESRRFAVLGAGTWGITLADLLARNGHQVRCWDIDKSLLSRIGFDRTHPRLYNFAVSPEIQFLPDLAEAIDAVDACVVVAPSKAMRTLCEDLAATGKADAVGGWVLCNKGIEEDSLLLMNQVLADVLGEAAGRRAVILSGPSHAEEVCKGMPTTLVASSPDPELARRIQKAFFRPYLRIYTHDDVHGVELGGSIKNVIAIAAGVNDGMGYGDNARAALITRGLAEIVRLGLAMGARLETFMGLSGVGDLIVTAGSRHSRNYQFGRLIAEGVTPDDALERIGMVVEGYPTARSAWGLARRHDVEMPITQAVYQICYEDLPPRQAVEDLMLREPKPEHYR
ncbi:MAG TPA: NAD(P)H-dependent glycerol-3-phosphate dehydrogenase [Candidatus Sumerlaeota bacterium]|nr:NAD(P)H-dependent glycerol-3-phosphate dehydrogenase [Candidatus Sumerlaeota bacterium]HOR28017.1 NAD(P)H-dependent glycerol-3-phosphate dehydrogenase [Candidatus Sumerlaeota bacterium]HPK02897.1 NAD(P)H-dependent glycerol-3-phosphate dehydrogenase [Candidatus Sumerlaeota bacterium]